MHPEVLRHVGLLALTTIGFPHTVAGLGWIEEVIESKSCPDRALVAHHLCRGGRTRLRVRERIEKAHSRFGGMAWSA
jgi:hypothetical protein